MAGDRMRTQAEPFRNVLICETVTDEIDNFELALAHRVSDRATVDDPAGPDTNLVGSSRNAMEYLARVRRPSPTKHPDRAESGFARRLGIVDVSHRYLYSHIRSLAEGRDFHDRHAPPTCGCKTECGVRRNCGRDEDRPPPTRRFKQAMQPPHRHRLRIKGHEPSECADLGPNVADLTREAFCGAKIVRATARDAPQERWKHSESRGCPSSRSQQTRKTRFVGALHLTHC